MGSNRQLDDPAPSLGEPPPPGSLPDLMPPDQRANARQQLAQIDWFGQIVVCAKFQSDDFVRDLILGSDHDAWNLVCSSQLAQHIKSVLPVQPQIQQHDVEVLLGKQPLCVRASARLRHLQTV
jgi:hypothetical protein